MEERSEGEGGGRFHPKRWIALIAALILLIFVLQNSREEEVDFLFATVTTPLFFALLVAAILGALVGYLAPRVGRGRD